MPDRTVRPVLVLLASHWLSMAGAALVTLAGFSWLFLLPLHIRGHVDNPYIGLLVFIAIPVGFFLGLALIPVGVGLARRRGADFAQEIDRKTAWRRVGIFFAVMTVVNVVAGSQLSYRAVEHMETVQFCGQSCHVMKPEFTAHQAPPHQTVACVSCHVAPGAAGWVQSKTAGTRQLLAVIFSNYPRPIESAIESNRLVPSADTCEQCHAREKIIGPRLRMHSSFKDDQANTRTETVLLMNVGGGSTGGIHGAHMGPGVHIRYAAEDKKRQTIPWVEYRSPGKAPRAYLAADAKPDDVQKLPLFEMQCVDCHNRPAHAFEMPDRALDGALAAGEIPTSLPFIKKTGLALLQAEYPSQEEAARKIRAGLASIYQQDTSHQDTSQHDTPAVQAAGDALVRIYQRNVFPELKVGWGTYPNNLGHVDTPGCFRCHDGAHTAPDQTVVSQDCNLCHQALAVEETSPEILKTLGLAK